MKIRRYKNKWLLALERPNEVGQPVLRNQFDTKEEAEKHIQAVSAIQAIDEIQQRVTEIRKFLKDIIKGHEYESGIL
jgi:hypothetical protein